MTAVIVSLAVTSTLHLTGTVQGRDSQVFSATGAGVAEAVIGAGLLWGAISLARGAMAVALWTTGFAIVAFVFGLSISARGGTLPDIAYHTTVLPLLVLNLVLIRRAGRVT